MLIRSLAAVTALMFVSLCSTAMVHAQDNPGGGRGRGGFGGPGGGGFGRGMTQSFDTVMVGLLRVEEVRKEVEVTTEQEELLTKLAERQRGERPEINFREASDEDRQKFMETMAKQATEAKEKVEEILDPSQFERLEQLTVQSLGIGGMINNADLAKKVGLPAEQIEKMKAAQTANAEGMREKMGELFQGGDREAIGTKMREMRKEQDDKLVAMLDDTQKSEYEKLKGKAFTFPEGRGGFGGPGGGFGGPGGGGPGGGGRGEGGPDGGGRGGNRPGGGRPAAE